MRINLLTITTTSESANFECHDRGFAKRAGVERPYPAPSRIHQSLFVRQADRAKESPGLEEYVVHGSRCPVPAECTRQRAVSLSPNPSVQVDDDPGDDRRVRRLTEFSEGVLPPARHFCISTLPALGRRERERVCGMAEPNEARAIPVEDLQFVASVRIGDDPGLRTDTQQRPRPCGQRRTRKPSGAGPHDRIVHGSVGRPTDEGSVLPAIHNRAGEFQPHRAVRLQRHEPDLTSCEHGRQKRRVDRSDAGRTGSKVQCDHPECTHVQDEEGVGIYPSHCSGCLDLARALAACRDRPPPLSIGAEQDDLGQPPVCDGDRSIRTYGDVGRPDQCLGFIEASGSPEFTPGELCRPSAEVRVCYNLTIGASGFTRSGSGQVTTGDQGGQKYRQDQSCFDASDDALQAGGRGGVAYNINLRSCRRPGRWRALASTTAAAAAAVAACSSPDLPVTTVADSAGISIVTNLGSPPVLGWMLDTVRLFGGDESGKATFYQVRQALVDVDPRGRIHLLEPGEHTIHAATSPFQSTSRWPPESAGRIGGTESPSVPGAGSGSMSSRVTDSSAACVGPG